MKIESSDEWKYFVGYQAPTIGWNQLVFDDSSWQTGIGGFGFGDGDDSTIVASTNSVFLRKTFSISDTSIIKGALFYIDYDDAFVAYINGVEIARENIGVAGIIPPYDENATDYREAQMYQGGNPENFVISEQFLDSILQNGSNVLSIQVHNQSISSSDLSAIPFLFLASSDSTVSQVQLPVWFDESHFGFSSHLPIISINTNGQQILDDPRIEAEMQTFFNESGYNNSTNDIPATNCQISIEIRGSSTQMFDKKSFGFETQTEIGENLNISLFGLPEENDWILYAPYSDKTLMRNVLTYELSQKMGWYAPRCVYCELYLNDEYWGIYVLMEKIKRDKNRVDISKLDSDDNAGDSLSGGYIFKVDWPDGSGVFDWSSPITNYNGNYLNLQYQFEYPDRQNITNDQAEYIEQYVSEFETVLAGNDFTDSQNGYSKYIDRHSFVDYYILQELGNNVDAYRLSNFYTKVIDSDGGKIYAGPVWDFNLAFGNADYGDGWETSGWALENPYVIDVIPFHLKRLQEDPDFVDLLRCRWDDLRISLLSESHIFYLIDSINDYLGEAVERNFDKWNILGNYVWPNYFVGNTYSEEITYLKNFISSRLVWIDSNLPGSSMSCQSVFCNKIVINEISFSAIENSSKSDWFEIYNRSTVSINLGNWRIKDENNLNSFTIPTGTTLYANNYLVFCSDAQKFLASYPDVDNSSGNLNWGLDANDIIRIYDDSGFFVDEVDFGKTDAWPLVNIEENRTLEIVNPDEENNNPANWFEGCPGGSPGVAYSFPCEENNSVLICDLIKIKIVPNPAKSEIQILNIQNKKSEYFIRSMDGMLVKYGVLDIGNNSINIEELKNSVYHIVIESISESYSGFFVKI